VEVDFVDDDIIGEKKKKKKKYFKIPFLLPQIILLFAFVVVEFFNYDLIS
jgi:hypothetical protein